jgi:hypothetical protein
MVFAASAPGVFGPFDGDAFGTCAACLPRTEGAVGRGAQGAAREGTGAEAGTGAEGREPPAFLQGIVMPFTEAVFGEGGIPGRQGHAAVLAVFRDPDGHGVGHGGWRAHGPSATREDEEGGEEERKNFFSHNRVCEMRH